MMEKKKKQYLVKNTECQSRTTESYFKSEWVSKTENPLPVM